MNASTFQLDVRPHAGGFSALFAALKARFTASTLRLSPAEEAGREADKVRRLADSYAKTDPGFAADLYAAASRHETAAD